ncbi:MAG: phosphoribosylanthranilate isomerase [Pseudomonadota bacterium]
MDVQNQRRSMEDIVIKICGITDITQAETSVDAGATHIGLVMAPASPRYVSDEKAREIVSAVKDRVRVVALVVDENINDINDRAAGLGVDAIQFHGGETLEQIAALERPTFEIWKAAPARDPAGVAAMAEWRDVAQRLVFDAPPPSGALYPGGHGVRFDVSVLSDFDGSLPFVLAGGLTPDNVETAIASAKAIPGFRGVDVSSGVEAAPGKKDPGKVAAFVAAAREALASPH